MSATTDALARWDTSPENMSWTSFLQFQEFLPPIPRVSIAIGIQVLRVSIAIGIQVLRVSIAIGIQVLRVSTAIGIQVLTFESIQEELAGLCCKGRCTSQSALLL